jgi:hypothetical protein
LTAQRGEKQPKRTMWFRGQGVPILYSSRRKDIFGSEDWIARGTTQKIGATIFATVFFGGSVALFVASPLVRAEISEAVGGVLGRVFGVMLAVLAFVVACAGIFLSFRLMRGIVRAFHSSNTGKFPSDTNRT